jgi:hypothetical protein
VVRCGGLKGPRARERGVLSGGLVVPAHASVPSDSVFFTLSGCQRRCSTTAALDPARRWPFDDAVVSAPQLLSLAVGFAPGFVTRMSVVCGWRCGFALVFSAVVCVQCPAMLMSQSNRPVSIVRVVTRVDVPIQPGEFVFSFSFFSGV